MFSALLLDLLQGMVIQKHSYSCTNAGVNRHPTNVYTGIIKLRVCLLLCGHYPVMQAAAARQLQHIRRCSARQQSQAYLITEWLKTNEWVCPCA